MDWPWFAIKRTQSECDHPTFMDLPELISQREQQGFARHTVLAAEHPACESERAFQDAEHRLSRGRTLMVERPVCGVIEPKTQVFKQLVVLPENPAIYRNILAGDECVIG